MSDPATVPDATDAAPPSVAHPAPSVRPGWWRRNRVPLLAFAILAVLTPTVIMGPILRARQRSNPTHPVVAEAGKSVEYGDASVGPATASFDDDTSAPANTHVVRVSIAISDATSLVCATPTLRELTGQRRRFRSLTAFAASTEPAAFDACDPEQGTAYELKLVYLIPDDAAGPFVVEIESSDLWPRYVQLKI